MKERDLDLEQALGQTLDGKYRIEELVGSGGMGAVFRATHVGTERPVAVKLILPSLVQNHEAIERFKREARAAGRLRHPNVVDVTDFGISALSGGTTAYLVMEYLNGTTLRRLIEEHGRLPLDVVVEITEQVALALTEAHRAGIIHRDLKPDNIWLIPDPRGGHIVRVLDFGIAKLREPGDQSAMLPESPQPIARFRTPTPVSRAATTLRDVSSDLPTALRASETEVREQETAIREHSTPGVVTLLHPYDLLTREGNTPGTPAYMSPEQCGGGHVDERSDIYSLGVVVFEMLTGKRPFEGNYVEVTRKHLYEPAPMGELERHVSHAVSGAVAKSLRKDASRRFASATAFAGSLRVAAEKPSSVLRRSIAFFAERSELFLRIAARCWTPIVLLGALAAFAITFLRHDHSWMLFAMLAGSLAIWAIITMLTNAAFALAIQRLRERPLDTLDLDALFAEMCERLQLPAHTSMLRIAARLTSLYVRSEMRATLGARDLSFLIAFLERQSPEKATERSSLLAPLIPGAYNWIRVSFVTAMWTVPLFQSAVVYALCRLTGIEPAGVIALFTMMIMIPVNTLFLNPVFSTALTLLYFRARQANGEEVSFSAIVPTRL